LNTLQEEGAIKPLFSGENIRLAAANPGSAVEQFSEQLIGSGFSTLFDIVYVQPKNNWPITAWRLYFHH
jgi:hypothetical protein